MVDALVIAGCLSGEKDDAGVSALVRELTEAVGADVVVRARTGGRPVGQALPDVLDELRLQGARRVLVATTHVVDGRLQHDAAVAVCAAAEGFEELHLAPPLLAEERDYAVVAAALDDALPACEGRVVALSGHRGAECEATFVRLERALRDRDDVLVDAPANLVERLRELREQEVLLGPFLMALGHHARRDVLDELAARLSARTWPHALAELPAIRALVVDHVCKLGTGYFSQRIWDRSAASGLSQIL